MRRESQDLSGLTMLVEMMEEDVWTPQRGQQQVHGLFPIRSARGESDEFAPSSPHKSDRPASPRSEPQMG